jgi:hypothetical protein
MTVKRYNVPRLDGVTRLGGFDVALYSDHDAEVERLTRELAIERKLTSLNCEMSEACCQCQDLRSRLAAAEANDRRYQFLRRLDAAGIQVYHGADDRSIWGDDLDAAIDAHLAGAASPPTATGNCGLCGQPRADHVEVAPNGEPRCVMKADSAAGAGG